jgi:diguanylate cyclase (GGDEF)-like protein/PAS domain S-box-containing protein
MLLARKRAQLSREFYLNILDEIADGVYFVNTDRIITYWNKAAEKITGYNSDEVIGKRCMDDILVHVDEQGNALCETELCPLKETINSGFPQNAAKVYFHHKNGHRVPVGVRTLPSLDKSGKVLGAVQIFEQYHLNGSFTEELKRLKNLALNDELTGVGNRRFGKMKLEACFNQFARYNWDFGILFLDIDHFKNFNDQFGHDAGDVVLKAIAQTISSNIRSFDAVSRWGGEEFIVTVLNVDEKKLKGIAEKLRILIRESYIDLVGSRVQVSVSVGATVCRSGDTVDSLITRADELMYKSKQSGRDKVTIE